LVGVEVRRTGVHKITIETDIYDPITEEIESGLVCARVEKGRIVEIQIKRPEAVEK